MNHSASRLRTECSDQAELHPEAPRRPGWPTTDVRGEGAVGDDPTAFALATRRSTSVSYAP